MKKLSLFSTDVAVFDALPGVNSLLPGAKAALLKERRRDPQGIRLSQVHGWHSPMDLAAREAPHFKHLIKAISNAVSGLVDERATERGVAVPSYAWRVLAWAIVLDPGGYNRVHDHPDSDFSVAFYIDAGDPKTPLGGRLSLMDPRRDATLLPGLDLDPTTLDLAVKTGMLVVFPSYLPHAVHPYDGSRPRIVLSANFKMDPDVQPYKGTLIR